VVSPLGAVSPRQCNRHRRYPARGYPIFKEAFENIAERKMTMELSMTIAAAKATKATRTISDHSNASCRECSEAVGLFVSERLESR
jgi:hypothetical protein